MNRVLWAISQEWMCPSQTIKISAGFPIPYFHTRLYSYWSMKIVKPGFQITKNVIYGVEQHKIESFSVTILKESKRTKRKLLILHLFSCVCIIYFVKVCVTCIVFLLPGRVVWVYSMLCVWCEPIGRYHKKHIHCVQKSTINAYFILYRSIVVPAIYNQWNKEKKQTYQKQTVDRIEEKNYRSKRICKWLEYTRENCVYLCVWMEKKRLR